MRTAVGSLLLHLSGVCFGFAGLAPVAGVAWKFYDPEAFEWWQLGMVVVGLLVAATLLNSLGSAVQGSRISGRR